MRLKGRVAIITGAARGIGEAQARALAAEGATVVLCDRAAAGHDVAKSIGGDAIFVMHDVTDEANWRQLAAMVEQRFGRIDILANTAGIAPPAQPLSETTGETFLNVFKVNTLGIFLGMKAVVEPMIRIGGGAIINTISAAALKGVPQTHSYAASKWAARGLSKSAAAELAGHHIRVNAIFPGPVATDLLRELGVDPDQLAKEITPAGFSAEPRDIANATVFLASEEARYIYGAELTVDGGQSL